MNGNPESEKTRYRVRRLRNAKYRIRDRSRNGNTKFMPRWLSIHYFNNRLEPDWMFNRRKSHPFTGFGVAYEDNPDAKKY